MGTERRRYPRRAVKVLVKRKSPGSDEPVTDYATNISKGGVFLQTTRRPTLGESFEAEFIPDPKEARPFRAVCEVCRVAPEGVGARFVRLDSDSALLLNLLASR